MVFESLYSNNIVSSSNLKDEEESIGKKKQGPFMSCRHGKKKQVRLEIHECVLNCKGFVAICIRVPHIACIKRSNMEKENK